MRRRILIAIVSFLIGFFIARVAHAHIIPPCLFPYECFCTGWDVSFRWEEKKFTTKAAFFEWLKTYNSDDYKVVKWTATAGIEILVPIAVESNCGAGKAMCTDARGTCQGQLTGGSNE